MSKRPLSMRQKIARAMQHPDDWVCEIVYLTERGERHRRTISPIRWSNHKYSINAMCFARCEPRNFRVSRIESLEMVRASERMMPLDLEVLK